MSGCNIIEIKRQYNSISLVIYSTFYKILIIIKKSINFYFILPIGGILDNTSLLTSQSPAALAEEYIVKSIWNHHFPAGSDLPANVSLLNTLV